MFNRYDKYFRENKDYENCEIINLQDGQESFSIISREVIDETIYVLYDLLNGMPRFERLKIPKQKNHDTYESIYNFNPLPMYERFLVQPTKIALTSKVSYNKHFGQTIIGEVEDKLLTEIMMIEKKMIKDSINQIKNNGYKLRTMFLNFRDARVFENFDPLSYGNEKRAYKEIGMIMYRTNEPVNFV